MRRFQLLTAIVLIIILITSIIGCTKSEQPVASSTAPGVIPVAGTAPTQTIEWQVQTSWGTEMLYYKLAQEFTERVKQLSNGRMTLKLLPVGAIAGVNETFDACSKGAFESYMSAPVYWSGKMPIASFLMSLPFGFTDYWQYELWYWGLGGIDLAREAYGKNNLRFIGIFSTTGATQEPIYMRENSPINSVDDLKGKKIRFAPGMQAEIMGKLGVSIVNLPGTEVYSALQTGVIDGAKVFGIVGSWDLGVHEVSKWVVMANIQSGACQEFTANMNAWNKLPEDLKAVLECAIREHSNRTFNALYSAELETKNKLISSGNIIVDLPEAEIEKIRQVAIPIWDAWAAKDPLATKALESMKVEMKTLGILK